jgi:hypothetical protein
MNLRIFKHSGLTKIIIDISIFRTVQENGKWFSFKKKNDGFLVSLKRFIFRVLHKSSAQSNQVAIIEMKQF